jgi:hypothetical protein
VTNAVAMGYVALRVGKDRMHWKQEPDCFKNTLQQIVDRMKGGYICLEPSDDEPTQDTAKGLLNWQTRMAATIVVPTVYSKDQWARRRLTLEELGHALNIPGDNKVKGMGTGLRKVVVTGPIPGKILAPIANSLRKTLGEDDKKIIGTMGKRERETPDSNLTKKRQTVVEYEPTKDAVFCWECVEPSKRASGEHAGAKLDRGRDPGLKLQKALETWTVKERDVSRDKSEQDHRR